MPEAERTAKLRNLCRIDLYFLLRYGLGRADMEKQWLLDRCREVQAEPDGRLDLWAREHYKSTIITYGLTIQDILNDPEVTVGLFSHTRPISKQFLRQIKREFEANERLKSWFPDILYANPQKESPKWSEDEGITVKRRGNPKEATVEAWGIVDGQPISKHFKRLVYDDVVTRDCVISPDMIAKVTEMWELSRALGSEGGSTRYIGTRYHFNDTYKTIMDRKAAVPRVYPCTADGTVDGDPVLLSRERVAEKRREMGPYTFGCQMLQDPKADETQGFKHEWIHHYAPDSVFDNTNRYILGDPASAKKKSSDYTALWVVALCPDGKIAIIDGIRDRLSLTQRADALFRLHRKHRPLGVGYEQYGLQADIEHFEERMKRENYRFSITPLGGSMPKLDRIRRLIPKFEQGNILLPEVMHRTDYQGQVVDLVHAFVEEEYKPFPVGLHDDMLDALARIADEEMSLVWPKPEADEDEPRDRYRRRGGYGGRSWMGA